MLDAVYQSPSVGSLKSRYLCHLINRSMLSKSTMFLIFLPGRIFLSVEFIFLIGWTGARDAREKMAGYRSAVARLAARPFNLAGTADSFHKSSPRIGQSFKVRVSARSSAEWGAAAIGVGVKEERVLSRRRREKLVDARARAHEDRKGDGIAAILEEVINRSESKIDLFCSGSSDTGVSSNVCALVYIRSPRPPSSPSPPPG